MKPTRDEKIFLPLALIILGCLGMLAATADAKAMEYTEKGVKWVMVEGLK